MRIAALFIALFACMCLLTIAPPGLAEGEGAAAPEAREAVDSGEASSEASSGEKVAEPPIVNKFVAASEAGLRTPEVTRVGVVKARAVGTSRMKSFAKRRAMGDIKQTAGRKNEYRILNTTYEQNKEKRLWSCIVDYEYWVK